jgi:hypothetical protein
MHRCYIFILLYYIFDSISESEERKRESQYVHVPTYSLSHIFIYYTFLFYTLTCHHSHHRSTPHLPNSPTSTFPCNDVCLLLTQSSLATQWHLRVTQYLHSAFHTHWDRLLYFLLHTNLVVSSQTVPLSDIGDGTHCSEYMYVCMYVCNKRDHSANHRPHHR